MNRHKKAVIAVATGNIIFGFSFLFSKVALEMTEPSVLLAVRFLTAFAVLNLIAFGGRKIIWKGKPLAAFSLKGKPLKYILLLALFQPIIYFIGENYGIVLTSSAFAGTIIAVIPIMGIVLDVLIMKSHVSKRQLLCALISVAGVAVTTLGAEDMSSSASGIIVLMIAVVAGGMFYVMSKKSAADYNPLERTYVMFLCGSMFYVTFALIQCHDNIEELIIQPLTSAPFWGCIIYLAVFSSVIAFILLNYGNSFVSVTQASLFVNLTTVISIVS